jgi:hypothetical protein
VCLGVGHGMKRPRTRSPGRQSDRGQDGPCNRDVIRSRRRTRELCPLLRETMDLEELVLPGGFRLPAKHDELSVGAPGRCDIAPQGRRASRHRVDGTGSCHGWQNRCPSRHATQNSLSISSATTVWRGTRPPVGEGVKRSSWCGGGEGGAPISKSPWRHCHPVPGGLSSFVDGTIGGVLPSPAPGCPEPSLL